MHVFRSLIFPIKIRIFHLALAGLLFIGVTAAHNAEALPFDPLSVGLSEGDQFRLAFVTSGTRNAESSDIADYNDFVQAEAGLAGSVTAGLGLTWTAIGSTATVDARDNTGTNPSATGVLILGLTGLRIADNNADLWDGRIDNPIGFDQNAQPQSFIVWTGTKGDGTADPTNELGAIDGTFVGLSSQTGPSWIEAAPRLEGSLFHFYAISETITVPTSNSGTLVPEPGTLALFSLGLLGLAAARRRTRR